MYIYSTRFNHHISHNPHLSQYCSYKDHGSGRRPHAPVSLHRVYFLLVRSRHRVNGVLLPRPEHVAGDSDGRHLLRLRRPAAYDVPVAGGARPWRRSRRRAEPRRSAERRRRDDMALLQTQVLALAGADMAEHVAAVGVGPLLADVKERSFTGRRRTPLIVKLIEL
ncbi:hypothetical protein Cni_G02688 [Canna indica]|uniref:Uncharacterized protein n=1 Tax=Canna indica TaxID=4628 RepID=A0AAQ3JQF7_9LILI|nr:hypothetical protein Cni_G02688 [Canna indica]